MERIADRARKDGISVRVDVIEGRPHHKIVEYAQTNKVDLIVICTRGRSGISRWLMGSVSSKVAQFALCSVVVVR